MDGTSLQDTLTALNQVLYERSYRHKRSYSSRWRSRRRNTQGNNQASSKHDLDCVAVTVDADKLIWYKRKCSDRLIAICEYGKKI